jgi:hypothetical protein
MKDEGIWSYLLTYLGIAAVGFGMFWWAWAALRGWLWGDVVLP